MGLYSDTVPLENDNGLLNKDNMYTVSLLATAEYAPDSANLAAFPDGTTIIRQGTKVTIALNAAKDGFEITQLYANNAGVTGSTYTSGWNACLIGEIHVTADSGTITGVTKRNGNPIDVMDVAASLIVCSDEAGELYLI